jgi:hypothetical protein
MVKTLQSLGGHDFLQGRIYLRPYYKFLGVIWLYVLIITVTSTGTISG